MLFPNGDSYSGFGFTHPDPERVLAQRVRYYERVVEIVTADLNSLHKALGMTQMDPRLIQPYEWPKEGTTTRELFGPPPVRWAEGGWQANPDGALARLKQLLDWANQNIAILTKDNPTLQQHVQQWQQSQPQMAMSL